MPIITFMTTSLWWLDTTGALLLVDSSVRLFESKPNGAGGRHFESYPARTSKRYGSPATPAGSLKQAPWGYSLGRIFPFGIRRTG
jgi:hypothetical protein